MASICLRTYLEPDLARRVSKLAERQGRSESALIAAAVRALMAGGDEGVARAVSDTSKRQLGRMEGQLSRIEQDLALQRELILMYVQVWLEYNPPLDEAIAASLAASADARLDRFLDLAALNLSRGGAAHLHALAAQAEEDMAQDAGLEVSES